MIATQYNLLNGAVFSAMQATINKRDTSTLAEEEQQDQIKGLSGAAALMQTNDFKVTDNNAIDSSKVQVMFNDPKSGSRVTLSLSKENFDSDDFYQRQDGVIRLNGKAEAFVGGWFGDIAYRQNYLAADADKSGRISDNETKNLKNSLYSTGLFFLDDYSNTELSISGYAAFDARLDSNKPMTIEDALNDILQKDKNLDGKLERIGEYETEDEAKANIDTRIQSVLQGAQISNASGQQDMGLQALSAGNDLMQELLNIFVREVESVSKMQKQILERVQQAQEAMRQLQKNNGNLAALSAEQRSALGSNSIVANKQENESLSQDELTQLQEELDNQAFDALSDATGISTSDLRQFISSSLDKPELTELDKELSGVIEAISTEVANNNVELFSTRV